MQPKCQYKFCPSCATGLQSKPVDSRQRLTCPKCGFIDWNNPKPTTSIILPKDGRVLLLKRAHEPFKGCWVLPGGYVESDEDPSATIIRETKEETGLDITVLGVIYTYLIDTDPRGNSVDIVFWGKITGGEMKLHGLTPVVSSNTSASEIRRSITPLRQSFAGYPQDRIHPRTHVRGILRRRIKLQEHTTFNFFPPDKLPELIAYKHRESISIWHKQQ